MWGAPETAAEEIEAGFAPLVAGNALVGWHGATENYTITDGVLVCQPEKGGNIYTDDEFADFVLRFEFRLTPGGNNGIGIRVPDGGHASTEGMEIQILDDTHPKYDKLKPYQAHGSVYGIIPAKKGHLRPTGEWNSEEISCVGRRVKVVLNGVTIVDGDLDEATRDGTLDGKEHPGARRRSGHICLCTHGSDVDFRNLRIRREPMPSGSPETDAN
ncbi:MAG: DUF1080 domain-containing protein [Planctomycetaceae bacterium]|nr:DUF1080 domain-containing protein [Planctomycetaceae bacterium]